MTVDETRLRKAIVSDLTEVMTDLFTTKLELELAKFFGQVTRYVDQRLDAFESRITSRIDTIEHTVNGLIVDRLDTDEIERAAMSLQLNRHGRWINVLAKKTKTKLSAP